MTTFADKAIAFFQSLHCPVPLPASIQVMNPYQHAATFEIVKTFFRKFYADTAPRTFLWGINPGRFGGGVTGIAFTDPFALRTFLGIESSLSGRREVSSEFIYTVIERWGGAKNFFGTFYINSLSPLGFTRHGKNYNFYDDAQLFALTKPFIVQSMATQLHFGANRNTAICLGTGKLYDIFSKLNNEYTFFERILPLEHPRFIMQYRRRQQQAFVEKYLATLSEAIG